VRRKSAKKEKEPQDTKVLLKLYKLINSFLSLFKNKKKEKDVKKKDDKKKGMLIIKLKKK
jgi:hypothetical protein